ncbi:MAG: hypothetical protein ACREDJ_04900, partial [Methylocella sp.]
MDYGELSFDRKEMLGPKGPAAGGARVFSPDGPGKAQDSGDNRMTVFFSCARQVLQKTPCDPAKRSPPS